MGLNPLNTESLLKLYTPVHLMNLIAIMCLNPLNTESLLKHKYPYEYWYNHKISLNPLNTESLLKHCIDLALALLKTTS